jgi:carbon-monoxide dehydrogenase large subunit
MKLGRPVKWTETRSENYQATTHGRDHVQEIEMAATRDGRITGLRGKVWAGMGAYLSTAAPGIPTILHGLMLSGPYKIPAVHEDVYGIYTNTTPVEAYRGAGRPEATFMLERLIDSLAREIGVDPVEVRRRNLLPPFEDGCDVITGLKYDSGNYQGALDKALDHVKYDSLRAEQARLRAQGKYIGIGVVTYVEICGLGPSQVAGAVGFQGGLWESAIVRFHPSGKVNVFIGASPHGQGEETTFAQVVSDNRREPGRRQGRARRHRSTPMDGARRRTTAVEALRSPWRRQRSRTRRAARGAPARGGPRRHRGGRQVLRAACRIASRRSRTLR